MRMPLNRLNEIIRGRRAITVCRRSSGWGFRPIGICGMRSTRGHERRRSSRSRRTLETDRVTTAATRDLTDAV
jgi:hypothetical protein